jgi:hypothetical protein
MRRVDLEWVALVVAVSVDLEWVALVVAVSVDLEWVALVLDDKIKSIRAHLPIQRAIIHQWVTLIYTPGSQNLQIPLS